MEYPSIPRPLRVVLADDHQLFREAVRMLLSDEPDLTVVAEASTADEAVALTLQYEPDILLLDLAMPEASGLVALERIAAVATMTRIILVTGAIEEEQLLHALRMGARGIVLKEVGASELLESIRVVARGEYFVGRECLPDLATALSSQTAVSNRQQIPDFGLTTRERQIVSAVANAYPNKEIAEKFAISEKTVKHHLTNIFNKVGVSSRLELALFALQHRLNSPSL
jgi:DNA-binding NarL/FixJ family response regulator